MNVKNLFLIVVVFTGGIISAAPLTRGLNNLGNTCFMNSTLQALAHLPEFVAEVDKKQALILPALVHATFNGMRYGQGAYSPDGLVEVLRTTREGNGGGFGLNQGGRQEDAHEFLAQLFDKLFPAPVEKPEAGVIGSMFEIQTVQENRCAGPGAHVSQGPAESKFMLELPLVSGASGLQELIRAYLAEEEIEFKCPAGDADKKKSKRIITKASPYLVIQLKRTVFDPVALAAHKDKRPITIPSKELSLGPLGTYDLVAIVIHDGYNFNAGHYYAFARNLANNDDPAWYLYNDSATPAKMSKGSMESWLSPKSPSSATPYLLFYTKRVLGVQSSYDYQGGQDYAYPADLTDLQKDALVQKSLHAQLDAYSRDKLLPACLAAEPQQLSDIIQWLGEVLDVETVASYDLTAHVAAGTYNDVQSLLPLVQPDPSADVLVLSTTVLSGKDKPVPALLWQPIITVQNHHYLALAAILKKDSSEFGYVTDDVEAQLSPQIDTEQKPALVIYYKLDGAQRRAGYLARALGYLPTIAQKVSSWFWAKRS